MTVEAATNFTICHTMDQEIFEELETAFAGYRCRIAMLGVQTCGTLTSMSTPLTPVATPIIDIEAIEWEQFAVELVATGGRTPEFVSA